MSDPGPSWWDHLAGAPIWGAIGAGLAVFTSFMRRRSPPSPGDLTCMIGSLTGLVKTQAEAQLRLENKFDEFQTEMREQINAIRGRVDK